jgi:multiple sugar transport system substrate-binding protein
MIETSLHQQCAAQEAMKRQAARRRNYTRRAVLRLSVVAPLGAALLAACGGAVTATVATTSAGTAALASTAVTNAPVSTSIATTTSLSTAVTAASAAATGPATASVTSSAATVAATATTSSVATASPAVSTPPTGASTISWFADDPGDAGLAVFKSIFTQFEKENPQYSVQLTNSDPTKFTASIAGGVYPDVLDTETKALPSWAYKQAVIDMTSYAQNAKVDPNAYTASQMVKVTLNGKWYGIPWDVAPAAIFYNKTLFRNSGVAEPPKKWGDPSWTWDTFLAAAKRLTTGSGDAATFGWASPNSWYYWNPWAWANGGEFSNKERTQITVTDSAYSDAFQWVADLINVQHVAPTATQAKQATWKNGKVAMMASGSYTTVGMDQVMKSTDWDIAPYPSGKAGAVDRAPADCCSMVNHAAHPDAGLAVMLFVTGLTGQKMLAQAGYVPVLKEAQQSAESLQPNGHVTRQVFIDGLQISRPTPIPIIYPDVNAAFSKALPDLLAGKTTAKDMMAKLQPQLQYLLDQAPPVWRAVD